VLHKNTADEKAVPVEEPSKAPKQAAIMPAFTERRTGTTG